MDEGHHLECMTSFISFQPIENTGNEILLE